LDEPTSALDLKNQVEIMGLIRRVVDGHCIAAVMTMHDLNMALRHADQTIFLKNGVIHAVAAPGEVTPEIIE
jgi:iron complex transport system ATP-binding protein